MAVACVTVEKCPVNYSVYCSICEVDVPMKWQNLKNGMSASNLSFNWGKNDKKTLKIFKVAFRQQIIEHTFLSGYPSSTGV